MLSRRKSIVLMGGELSGYTFDLFDTVASQGEIDVRYLHNPLDGLPSFQHEATESRPVRRLLWQDATWTQIRRFMREPIPHAVFVYGTRPRLKMELALSSLPSAVPAYYAADTNIIDLVASPTSLVGRRLACLPIRTRSEAALSLGLTNRWALQALGFKQILEIPQYAVDFAALDAAAARVEPNESRGASRKIILLIVARLVPVKSLPGFIGYFAQQQDLVEDIRIVVAGDGPDRPALEEAKRRFPNLELDLLGAVPRHRIGEYLSRADALVLPSSREPWGIVVVEALGMGVPVIATPTVGAAVSLAGSTQAVLLSDTPAPESVVAAIRKFGACRATITAAALACRQQVRARYDRIEVATRTIKLVDGQH
jgi:glycosyltransferase involved in cell wall biosynthesis